jgi:hypothetical protein
LNLVNRAAVLRVSNRNDGLCRLLTGNRKTRDGLLVLILEAETLGVAAEVLNGSHLKVDPVLAIEDFGAVLRLSNSAGAVTIDTSTEASETNTDVDGGQVGLLRSGIRRVLAEAL